MDNLERFTLSTREVCDKLKVNRRSVLEARRTGRLVEGEAYISIPQRSKRKVFRYDPNVVFVQWYENASRPATVAAEQRKRGLDPETQLGVESTPAQPSANTLLADVRVRSEEVKLKKQQIELAKMRGELVDRAQVYKQLYEFGQRMRETLLNVPGRCVDQVLAASSRNEALSILDGEMRVALAGLADIEKYKNGEES